MQGGHNKSTLLKDEQWKEHIEVCDITTCINIWQYTSHGYNSVNI